MDIVTTPPYADMQRLYKQYYSLGYFNTDINTRFALISLVGYLNYKLGQKKPDINPYKIIKKIIGDNLPEDFIKGISVVIEDFSYKCTEFPTFGIPDKEIPRKVKEILNTYVPF